MRLVDDITLPNKVVIEDSFEGKRKFYKIKLSEAIAPFLIRTSPKIRYHKCVRYSGEASLPPNLVDGGEGRATGKDVPPRGRLREIST